MGRRSLVFCGVLCLTGQGGTEVIGESSRQAKTTPKRHSSASDQRRRRSQTFRSNAANNRRAAELSYQWLFGYAKADSAVATTSDISGSSYIVEPETTTATTASSDCLKEIELVLSNPDVESEYGFEDYQPDPEQQLVVGCDQEPVDTITPRTSERTPTPAPQPTSRPGRPSRLPGDKDPPIAGDITAPSPSALPSTVPAASPSVPSPSFVPASSSEDWVDKDPGFTVPKYGKKTPDNGMTGKKSSMSYAPAASSDDGKKTGKKQAPSVSPTPTEDKNPPVVSLSPTSSPAPTGECADPRTCGRPPRPI